MHGAELSYNQYVNSREIKNLDVKQLFLYHRDILVVTVHKGKVIRVGNEVLFKPGFGEYVKVKIPSYFSINDKMRDIGMQCIEQVDFLGRGQNG